jgi:hypothetical protein
MVAQAVSVADRLSRRSIAKLAQDSTGLDRTRQDSAGPRSRTNLCSATDDGDRGEMIRRAAVNGSAWENKHGRCGPAICGVRANDRATRAHALCRLERGRGKRPVDRRP